jgi:heme oxygenase
MDLDTIKAATWDLHIKAERAGIVADIIAGRASRYGVALLLRNLLPVYQILDASRFCNLELARSLCIQADLDVLSPDDEVPLLPEGAAYADKVSRAGQGDGSRLIAHAYVRYLGDLNGGQVMQRRLAASLGDLARRLTFHDYPSVADKASFTRDYRTRLDRAVQLADHEAVLHEARLAFEVNIAMSDAVRTAAARPRT